MDKEIMAKPLEVIVVDDQADLAESTGKLLRLHGHIVTVFHSAQDVLDALESLRPDLILADIRMPHMDGCQLAAYVKQRPGCKKVILAALTGLEDDESRKAAIAAGFDYRFVKPMHPDDLQHFLDEIGKTRR
jgi:CheY-like chemotaxis protein